MADNNYAPVEDGWKNQVTPCWVEVANDHFNENSLVVILKFKFGEGMEMPKAELPLLYGTGHVITKWENGEKREHKATADDQKATFELLAALYPAWVEYNKQGHGVQEMLHWFENEGRDAVLATPVDIKVWHSQRGFPNATVKDPRNAKPKKAVVTRADAIARAASLFGQMFGTTPGAVNTMEGNGGVADDSAIPF